MSKRKTIYRYYYNVDGTVETMLSIKENSRFGVVSDLPYVDTDVKYNINEKKYDAKNKRWTVNQNPAPSQGSNRR